MTMKKRPLLSDLKLHPPYRVFRKGKDGVVGLDTESLITGYAFLITDYPFNNCAWIKSRDDVLKFLVNEKYRSSFNTFWNLDFDVTVLLKWFGLAFCKEMVEKQHASYNGVVFTYIPKRFLSVRTGRYTNTFYDACQYYLPRSLDGASKRYLNEGKIEVGSKEFHESDYGREDLLKYCRDDSRKCCLLTRKLLDDLHDMGFSPSTLSSSGTIMEEAIVGDVHLPDITKIPQGVLEYAYDAYKGGWMECFKRGHFTKLYDYDITSAYPYQVAELIELKGEFKYIKGEVDNSRYALGYVKTKVYITESISPVIFQGDVNYTTTGRWMTKLFHEEVDFIRTRKRGTAEVIDGWYFEADPQAQRPFYYPMRQLFRQKKSVANAWLPKSLSVSLYGKLAQKDWETGETGNLFNPVWATPVTARTRMTIADYALVNPSSLCVIATDGLALDSPLPSRVLSKSFGGLQLKYADEGVVIGTNVYTIKGKDPGGEWRPGRFDWLHKLAKEPDQDKYDLKFFRYTTLAEGVDGDFEKVGVFGDFPYTFDINFDHKRYFKRLSCGGELLEDVYESAPWQVGIVEERKRLWEMDKKVKK